MGGKISFTLTYIDRKILVWKLSPKFVPFLYTKKIMTMKMFFLKFIFRNKLILRHPALINFFIYKVFWCLRIDDKVKSFQVINYPFFLLDKARINNTVQKYSSSSKISCSATPPLRTFKWDARSWNFVNIEPKCGAAENKQITTSTSLS